MSDDTEDKVVGLNGKKGGGNGGGQKPEDILASINGEFKAQKAKEFKQAATAVLREIEEAKKVLKLAEIKLEKLVEQFRVESQ